MTRDFLQALKDADRAAEAAGMPSEVDRRLRERLGLVDRRAPAPVRWPRFALAAFAGACALLLVALRLFQPAAPAELGGFLVSQASADFGAAVLGDQAVQVTRGAATLVDRAEGISLAALGAGTVKKEEAAVRVVAGTFRASVVHRAAGAAPARVLVSDGAIEVLGTQFTVDQQARGGRVTLHEGSIRFVAPDGRAFLLTPGESLSWPVPAAAPIAPAAPEPEPTAAPADVEPAPAAPEPVVRPAHRVRVPVAQPEVTQAEATLIEAARIEDLLLRIDEQRSRGQYPAAAAELEQALQAGYSPATRERLSFELGTILSRPGQDPARACTHWRDHSRRFPHGRYDREIVLAVQRLDCPGP